MPTPSIRLLFAAIYIAVDLIYVFSSRNFYDAAVARITSVSEISPTRKPMVIPVAVLTYAVMAAGWYFLVAPVAETGYIGLTLFHALLVGLLMYGVFNGTLYVLFEKWTAGVALRDLAWGLFWITTVSLAYCMFSRSVRMSPVRPRA